MEVTQPSWEVSQWPDGLCVRYEVYWDRDEGLAAFAERSERLATMRALPDGFELDDDPARLDLAGIHGYLSEESYWAAGRTREAVEASIAGSAG